MSDLMPIDATTLPVLDWRTMPLSGRVLIEASAGTGKTWNIGLIYLRLLLERGLRVEQILVTTFTDAAAQELRERLRRRLIEAERLLQSPPAASDDEASPSAYLADLFGDATSKPIALRRIQLARAGLDRAPIATIHALCQRIQRDYPLESGAAFAPDALFDEAELLRECVEDFWRRRYLVDAVDPAEAAAVLKAGPQGLLRDLRGLFAGHAHVLEADGLAAIPQLIARLAEADAVAELQRLANDKSLYAPAKRALKERLRDIAMAFEAGADVDAVLAKRLDDAFKPDKVIEQQPLDVRERLNDHALIQLLQQLHGLLKLRGAFVRGRVLADAARFCREEMPRRARARRVVTFAMQIDDVWQRLCGPQADATLADRLFEAFPAALIDEFQDTDTRQYAIFERIYRGRGTLVMIGDPKQAIYGFRGGDIAAYLAASAQTTQRYSLATNHRSAGALVAAMNSLYRYADGGFDHPQIRYQPVAAGERADERPYAVNGAALARPFAIHRFHDEQSGTSSTMEQLEKSALDDCALRIVELLEDDAQSIGGHRITPGDIAVLLPTHTQIAALRTKLVALGVPCIGHGRGNIFDTPMAAELELLLYAVLHAEDDQAVRGALATHLLGVELAQIAAWRTEPAGFERELERFEEWRVLTRTRGVLALIEAVLAQRAGALLARPDGERLLTDLRHLGELLAAESGTRQGLEGLYAWYVAARREGAEGDSEAADERQLRIESDSRRVQLLTIHASKGLEFPIVFLPLAWRVSDRRAPRDPKLLRFHADDGQASIDLGSAEFPQHRGRHFREDLQERLRLLYVALTRAIYAVHVYWVDRKVHLGADELAWQVPAIDFLLSNAQQQLPAGEDGLPLLVTATTGLALFDAVREPLARYRPALPPDAPRAAQSPWPAPRMPQWLHSFSSLTRRIDRPLTLAGGAADDEVEPLVDESLVDAGLGEPVEQTDDPTLLALYPLRGPGFGNAVHGILERAKPGPLWPVQRHLLSTELNAQGLHAPGLSSEEAQQRVARLIERVRSAELADGLSLGALADDACVAEFEFQFPVHRASVARLRQLCAEHDFPALVPAGLSVGLLNGMLTGFADLIFHWQGRYHVLDYKTNWLGARLADYQGRGLQQAMDVHHYPLQALLYTVALHRYLRQRMDVYTAEDQLGDSWYLFVRGVGLRPGLGIWRQRWPVVLIEAIDDAFAGNAGVAA